jgi:hydroxyacylglutathione hydrolase
MKAVHGETITHIFVTHTHMDHSPNTPRLVAATGAKVYADGNPLISRRVGGDAPRTTEGGGDAAFKVDVKLKDGQVVDGQAVDGDGWSLQAVSTPGHASNHMAFAWRERKILFSGDHVMGWSTSIVSPPDGSMPDYMASLEKLLQRDEDLYFCGHGPEVRDAKAYVGYLQRHRKARERSILHRLSKGAADVPTIVRASYIGIDPRLVPAAGRSVFAHLEDLVTRKVVATDGEPSIDGTYRLVAPLA